MPSLVKRNEIVAFLKVADAWKIIGNRMTTGSYTYEAQTTDEVYIVDELSTTTIDSYKISMDGEMKCYYGDPVYDYINGLRYNLATGTDAETEILLIDKYDLTNGAFKAQTFRCSVTITSYGGDGGETPVIGFTIAVSGNATNGTATIAEGVPTFTPEGSI